VGETLLEGGGEEVATWHAVAGIHRFAGDFPFTDFSTIELSLIF
jgi:hypothetical protein